MFFMWLLTSSVAGMWKDWEDSLLLNPNQLTLSSCLELLNSKVVQDFFGDIDVKELMQVNLLHPYNKVMSPYIF